MDESRMYEEALDLFFPNASQEEIEEELEDQIDKLVDKM